MKNILVIEDNEGIAELISSSLNEGGFAVSLAATGKEALELLSQKNIDIIILDYSLPDMDGKEIIEVLKREGKKIPPFIVSTGRGDEQLAVDMMKLGAYDYLIKDRTLVKTLPEVVAKLENEIQREEQLKAAQQALRESEERFRNFVEKSSDFFVKISGDGYLQYVSPNWENHLQYRFEEIRKKPIFDLIFPEDTHDLKNQLKDAARKENQHFEMEYRIMHKDGSLRVHGVKGYSVRENDQVFINCIARDITQTKQAEKRLAKAVFEAEEKEKKKFAEELHEGIGPLVSTIKLSIDRMKTMKNLEEKELKVIEYASSMIDDTVSRIRNLANDLMPVVISDFGLVKALLSYVNKQQHNMEAEVHVIALNKLPDVDKTIALILYRAITKLIQASLKYSNAVNVWVKFKFETPHLLILFSDDGEGFLQHAKEGNELSISMENMQKRLSSVNGKIHQVNPARASTQIKISVPVIRQDVL